MDPASQPASLNADERQVLRAFISAHRHSVWENWCCFGVLALLVSALFVGGQILARWAPGYWEGRGFVLCSRHQTLHHGTIYLPADPGIAGLLGGPGVIAIALSVYLAMFVLMLILQQRRARRVANLLERILSDSQIA